MYFAWTNTIELQNLERTWNLPRQQNIWILIDLLCQANKVVYYRRFSAKFGLLRLEQRKVKNSRNADLLEDWSNEVFEWPAKEVAFTEDTEDDNEVPDGSQVTMSGRATGEQYFIWLKSSN